MVEIIPNWHPIFVHFTIALLLTSVALHIATLFVRTELKGQWQIVACWTLWFGAAVSVFTLIAGFYAFNTVEHDDPSHAAMLEHRNWAFVTLIVFFLLAIWSVISARNKREPNRTFIVLLAIAGLFLISTAWHGGELVYRHGIGVMALPEPDKHSHAHRTEDKDTDHHDHQEKHEH